MDVLGLVGVGDLGHAGGEREQDGGDVAAKLDLLAGGVHGALSLLTVYKHTLDNLSIALYCILTI